MELWQIRYNLRYRYTREQKKAMSGKIPMTEELFWGCVYIARARLDTVKFRWLLRTFPEYLKKYSEEYDREYEENPEFREEQDNEWKRIRSLLVEDYGEEYVKEHFRD